MERKRSNQDFVACRQAYRESRRGKAGLVVRRRGVRERAIS